MMGSRQQFAFLAAVLAALLMAAPAHADSGIHFTDGAFTTPIEWNNPDVNKTFFPVVGNAGGAYLYVEQGDDAPHFGDDLYLLYDYVNATTEPDTNTFFDVLFQVPSDSHDYLVRIHDNGSLETFEKPAGTTSNILPNGSFDTSSPWTSLSPGDLTLAQFEGAIGFGTSPDSSTQHQIAEFELTIGLSAADPGGPQDGLYDPAPAFWSASKGNSGAGDPPISSGIFTLNPDGTVTVVPVLNAEGGPVQQLPEPASFILLAVGATLILQRGPRRI